MRLKKKNFQSIFFFKELKEKLGVFLSKYNERKKTKNKGKKTKTFWLDIKRLISITTKGIKKKIIKNSIANFFFRVLTIFPQLKTCYHFL